MNLTPFFHILSWRAASRSRPHAIRMLAASARKAQMENSMNPTSSRIAHAPQPVPPDTIPGQVPHPGRDPEPDQPIDPEPDQPVDPTIPPIGDPVPDGVDDEPIRDPGPHPGDPPRR